MNLNLKRILSVIGIGLGVIIMGMVWSIANTALSTIQKDLDADVLDLQWMMNCFGIFLCVPLLTMGKLGDAYGRKGLFIIGLFGALVASSVAGFSNNVKLLIACMGLFGLAGSIILPLSQALLVHQFPENEKDRAVGLWSIFASISLASGPLVGGLILHYWGWRWIYWINIPILLLIIPLFTICVKKEEQRGYSDTDWKGVGFLAIVIGTLVLGIMQGPSWGWDSALIIGLFVIAAVSLIIFLVLERKTSSPLFRPDLFLQRDFLLSAIPNACMIGYMWVIFFLVPLYLQNIVGYSPLRVGILLLLVTLPVALLAVPVGKIYRKYGSKIVVILGYIFLAIASIFHIFSSSKSEIWLISLGCLMMGIGWVLIWGPSISNALMSLPHNAAGIASGMFTTLQEFGGVVILAVGGVIFRTTHQNVLNPQMRELNDVFQNLSLDEKESLLTNPIVAKQYFTSGSSLFETLKTAFIVGYQNAFWFLVGICLLAIVLSFFLKKGKRNRQNL